MFVFIFTLIRAGHFPPLLEEIDKARDALQDCGVNNKRARKVETYLFAIQPHGTVTVPGTLTTAPYVPYCAALV